MSGIESWSTNPANNNQSPPFGWPAGMLPSQVEPTARQDMASIAAWYQAAQWINYNNTPVYISATQFKLAGVNVTGIYQVGRRVQATDGTTSVYGTITASTFSTDTTVTISWDSGVLQTGVTIVYVGIISVSNTSMPAPTLVAANFANPTATVGLTEVNGTATTAMRSDAAPALSQAIAPTWSGQHLFTGGVNSQTAAAGASIGIDGSGGSVLLTNSAAAADAHLWEMFAQSTAVAFRTLNDAFTVSRNYLAVSRSGVAVTGITFGNATDNPSYSFSGSGTATINGPLTVNTGGSQLKGGITVTTPASGTALTLNGTSAATSLVINNGASGLLGWQINDPGAQATNIFARTDNGEASIRVNGSSGSNNFALYTAGSQRVVVNNAGAVTVNAPSSGAAITGTGVAGNYGVLAQGSSTAGSSLGLGVIAGTNSSDNAVNVVNQANTSTYFRVRGDGLVQAVDLGGTMQTVGWRGCPINTQGSNYTLVASDQGKMVQMNGTAGQTCTVPNGVFSAGDVITISAFNGTTAYTIVQGSGLSMYWGGNGATTGNRTFTSVGVCTVVFQSSSQCIISGSGLS